MWHSCGAVARSEIPLLESSVCLLITQSADHTVTHRSHSHTQIIQSHTDNTVTHRSNSHTQITLSHTQTIQSDC